MTLQIGKAIRTRRHQIQMTQTVLSVKAKVSQATIAQVELGERLPSLRTTLKIFKVLKLKLVIQ